MKRLSRFVGPTILLVLLVSAPAQAALPPSVTSTSCLRPFCAGLSDDGSRVVFSFTQPLSPGAPPGQIYEREGGVTRGLIDFPGGSYSGALGLKGVSGDAHHAFVGTTAALTADDLDGAQGDVYDIHDGTTELISTGPNDPGAAIDGFHSATFDGASENGSRVFFDTDLALVPDDLDRCTDIYERSGGQTTLISTGPAASQGFGGNVCDQVRFGGVSRDGTHAFFTSSDHLVSSQSSGEQIYQRVGDQVTSLTADNPQTRGCHPALLVADASSDGGSVLFLTSSAISSDDADTAGDAYLRSPDGSFTLVSRGTNDTADCIEQTIPVALSADGRTAIFATTDALAPDDRDSSSDLYSVSGDAAPTLVTTGATDPNAAEPISGGEFSDDLDVAAFETDQALVAQDTDASTDVYERSAGATRLVSVGPTGGDAASDATLVGVSGDGRTIGFATKEQMTDIDTDRGLDFYERRDDGTVTAGARRLSARRIRARTVLVSAESIPPRLRVGRSAKAAGRNHLRLRIGCPGEEESGPCTGTVRIGPPGRRRLAYGWFRIPSGASEAVGLKLARRGRRNLPARPVAVVRGRDRLGNRSTLVRRIHLL